MVVQCRKLMPDLAAVYGMFCVGGAHPYLCKVTCLHSFPLFPLYLELSLSFFLSLSFIHTLAQPLWRWGRVETEGTIGVIQQDRLISPPPIPLLPCVCVLVRAWVVIVCRTAAIVNKCH